MCVIFTVCKVVSTCGSGYLYVRMYVPVCVSFMDKMAVCCCLYEPVME